MVSAQQDYWLVSSHGIKKCVPTTDSSVMIGDAYVEMYRMCF